MSPQEAIEIIKFARAEVERNYSMNYAVDFETAIEVLEKQMPNRSKHIIENDTISMIAEAFEALYPGVKYEAAYAPDIRDSEGTSVCSCITFPNEEDGPDAVPVILLNIKARVGVVAEAFAQELAHVALGPDSLVHTHEYYDTVELLGIKYNEIAEKRFPSSQLTQTEGGADDEAE